MLSHAGVYRACEWIETTDLDKDSDGDIADVGWVRLGADIVGDKAMDFTGGLLPVI